MYKTKNIMLQITVTRVRGEGSVSGVPNQRILQNMVIGLNRHYRRNTQ